MAWMVWVYGYRGNGAYMGIVYIRLLLHIVCMVVDGYDYTIV